MKNKHKIGIVGGMGPSAGVDLFQKIINLTTADYDNEHISVSLISEPNLISDRTEFLMRNININPAIGISEVINHLYHQKANIIGIPCNTAHSPKIFNEILNRIPSNIQLINMIDSVCKYIKEKFPLYENIGILSTSGTYLSNVYPDYLSKYKLNGVQVTQKIQDDFINESIYNKDYGIKSFSNPPTIQAKENLILGVNYLISKKVDAIILGCTEIPLVLKMDYYKNIPFIDSTKILAREMILQYSPNKLKEN